MVEELKLAIKIDDASIEQSLLKQFANAQKMADKVVLDFKNVNFDDKQIEAKFKEMQKKAGQNPIDLTIGGNTLNMLGQIDKRLTEIFSIGKGKSFIDSSSIVADIGKIENKINELNKKYEESQKKLSSIGSGNISGKDVNLVDNKEFQKLSQEVSELKNQFDDLKTHMQLLDDYTVPTDRFFELQSQVETTTVKVSDLVEEFTKLSNAQKALSSAPQESNISLTSDSTVEQQIKSESELNSEIEKRENIIRELQQLQEKLTVHEDFHGNDRYFADQLPTEEEIREADKRIKQLTGTNNIFNIDKLIQDRNKWLSEVKYSLEEYDDLIKANDQKALDEYTTRGLSRIGGAESFFGYEDNNFSIASKFVEEKEKIQNEINDLYTDLDKLDEKMNLDSNNSSVDNTVQSQEKLQSELKETQKQAEKTAQAVKESTTASTGQKKDAFPSTEATASVEKVADGFKEVKQETEKATESAKEYGKILSQVGLVGKKYNEFGEQIPSKYSYTRQTGENQVQTITVKFEKDKESGEIVEREIIGEYITGFQALEKEIDKTDKKIFDLKKNLESNKIKLGDNYDTSALDKLIEDAENDANMLYDTLKKVYSEQSEYEYSIAQYDDERAKKQANYNTQLENTKKIEEARAKNASDKKTASDEEKRQKSIEQTNRLLNKQQILIDEIEKTYSKTANPDLDRVVSSQSDLTELANKKADIQNLINQLTNQGRNSLNENDFLLLEKYISEYKQLAKDKLKANNPSKQELGGQQLDVLLSQQVAQYNQLIAKAEKYGDATADIVQKLKDQRDTIAEINSDGIYTAKSGLKADDYYSARDNYKIGKAEFTSYETDIKSASNVAKQEASNIQAEWDKNLKAIQDYMDGVTKLNNLKAKDKGTGSEANQIELQTKNVEKLKQAAFEARQNLSSMIDPHNVDIDTWNKWLKAVELLDQASQGSAESVAKLKDVLDNIKAPSLDKYENKLSTYQAKKAGYDATIARFNDGGWTSDTYLKNVQAVKDAVKKYEDLLSDIKAKGGIASEEDVQKLKEYEGEIKKTISTVTNMSAAEKGYNFVSAQKELDKIHKLLEENSRMSSEAKNKIKAYYAEIESGNPSMSLDRIHGEIMKIYNAEVEAGRAGKSMWSIIKSSGLHQIAAQMAGMFGFYDVINIGKNAFNTVKELDYALVDLKKTTAMNSSELEQFYYDSNDVAKQMGVTTKEIIDQASSWSRLNKIGLLYGDI